LKYHKQINYSNRYYKWTTIDRNIIIKSAKDFSEHNAKFLIEIPYRHRGIVKKKTKGLNSVMTSMTIFTLNQNLFNVV